MKEWDKIHRIDRSEKKEKIESSDKMNGLTKDTGSLYMKFQKKIFSLIYF